MPKPGLGASPSDRPLIKFLDLAWGGLEGQATYPPFVNGKAVRTVENPDGQPIFRTHDTQQLKETLKRCRRHQHRQPNTDAQRCAQMHSACKRHVRCSVTPVAIPVCSHNA